MKKANYVTEDYLDGKLSALKQELKEEIVEMREEHKQYKDEVLTKLDDISGQLENLNEDKTLAIHQTSQLNEKVDNHESRIKRLEKIQQAA
jgi:hypothetical protein